MGQKEEVALMEETVAQTLNRLRQQGRLSQLAVSETGFSFDPRTGQSFTVNETGLFALNLLINGGDAGSIARGLADSFEVEEEMARSAVEVFIRQLGRYLQ